MKRILLILIILAALGATLIFIDVAAQRDWHKCFRLAGLRCTVSATEVSYEAAGWGLIFTRYKDAEWGINGFQIHRGYYADYAYIICQAEEQ